MSDSKMNVVLTTADTQALAEKLGVKLVESRLAACVQEFPISSRYRWEGGVQCDSEILLLIKTACASTDKVIDLIKTEHTYDVPEIIVLPVTGGLSAYIEWVNAETT